MYILLELGDNFSASFVLTTRPPAVPDVLRSGLNVGALRQARQV